MELQKLSKVEYIQNYILGGTADIVVTDTIKDLHINYTITKDKKDDTIYYVRFKSHSSIYIGFIKTKEVKVNQDVYNIPEFKKKSNLQEDYNYKAEVFHNLILYIYYLNKLPNNIEILYTGRCSVCNRQLTNPDYIAIGIGEICLQKM